MAANVESMFYVREKPWHGLGTAVKEAPTSADALIYAGLDWTVEQKDVFSELGLPIEGYKANTRSTDNSVLGVVSDRYKVVQNEDFKPFHWNKYRFLLERVVNVTIEGNDFSNGFNEETDVKYNN